MEKCYLFGAGVNCYGVIKFIGKQNIVAVIDNSESKKGFEIEGIKIIHFSDFLIQYCNETIIISAYYAKDEIRQQLQEHGINNFVVAPYMQKGYYDSYEDFIYSYKINEMKELYIYGENYFSTKMMETIKRNTDFDGIIKFVRDSEYPAREFESIEVVDLDSIPYGTNLLLTTERYSYKDKDTIQSNQKKLNIISIYEPKKKKHYELQKFKNLYTNKRCFIIGNGPSLNVDDLDVLKVNNEICFGSNWIIKIFEKTGWRPNYYVIVNYNFMRQMPQNMIASNGEKIITFHADFFSEKITEKNNMYAYQAIPYEENKLSFSDDIIEGVYSSHTVTYDMIQIAAYMGFNEIYLLGVDCNDGSNHFYKADDLDKSKLENRTTFDDSGWNELYDVWIKGYKEAEVFSRQNNFRIFNATRGGALEVFERVNFDNLF